MILIALPLAMMAQFKRVDFGEWALLACAISVIVLTSVFLTVSIRAFILPKSGLDRLASLPLDDANETESTPSTPHPTNIPS